MFKSVFCVRFRSDIDRDAARRHWTSVHGPLGAKLPGLLTYTQNHMLGALEAAPMSTLRLDGYACELWPDQATFEVAMRSPEWRAVIDDDSEVFEAGSQAGMSAYVEERLINDGFRAPFKVVWFLRFRADLEHEEANDHWLNRHGRLVREVPGLGRHLQNYVLGSLGLCGISDEPVVFDGFSEFWFQSKEAFAQVAGTPEWRRLKADTGAFLQSNEVAGMSGIVEERVIRSSPRGSEGLDHD